MALETERERRFWDAQARATSVAATLREARALAEEPLWRWAMTAIREQSPVQILDLGCGRGATSLLLAGEERARVVGIDISLGSLHVARSLARQRTLSPAFAVGALESLPFADHSFDVVAGRFVLHHVHALAEGAAEIARVLRPGGRAVFVETWGRNPILRFGREVAGLAGIGLGTDDERPIDESDLAVLARHFRVERHFPVFTAFELSNRLWRQGMPLARRSRRLRDLLGRTWVRTIRADRWVEANLPGLRPWGWFVGLVLERRA